MIPVIETNDGFEPVGGNPTLTSLDGEIRAPLAVLLHHSWTDEERARFGVYVAESVEIPKGKEAVGMPRYERMDGKVVQVYEMQDVIEPAPMSTEEKIATMLARFGLTIEDLRGVLSSDAVRE